MAEALAEMLGPAYMNDASTSSYLTFLAELPISKLTSSEPQLLSAASHSLLLSVQSLSKRSYKSIVGSADKHASLRQTIPTLLQKARELRLAVPKLDSSAVEFAQQFSKSRTSQILTRRRQVLRLLQNSERLVDVMELPPLLFSAISTIPPNHSSVLDLYAHVRRLSSLYPASPLVMSVLSEAEVALRQLAVELIQALQAPGLKLAGAVRTAGWLKRVIHDLQTTSPTEGVVSSVFLVCRLTIFLSTLEALEPLRQLADGERTRHSLLASLPWSGGQQSERFLKRYIEVFREHSFGIVSVFKSLSTTFQSTQGERNSTMRPLPSPISTLPLYLVEMLLETLQVYLPAVRDQTARESILTQVMYCAGSLGRLGADFGMLLAVIGVTEWVDLVKRHRLLAGRLDIVIGDHRGYQKELLSS